MEVSLCPNVKNCLWWYNASLFFNSLFVIRDSKTSKQTNEQTNKQTTKATTTTTHTHTHTHTHPHTHQVCGFLLVVVVLLLLFLLFLGGNLCKQFYIIDWRSLRKIVYYISQSRWSLFSYSWPKKIQNGESVIFRKSRYLPDGKFLCNRRTMETVYLLWLE